MFEKIIVATDGSEHSERAAKMIAKLSGGTVTAVYVADVIKEIATYRMVCFLGRELRELLRGEESWGARMPPKKRGFCETGVEGRSPWRGDRRFCS